MSRLLLIPAVLALVTTLSSCKEDEGLPTPSAAATATAVTDVPTTPSPTATAPATAAGADWSAFHGGGPLTGVAAPLPGGPELKVRWTYDTADEDPADVEGGAAIVGDTVYVADTDSTLHAIDLKTGKKRWTYKTDAGFTTTPLVHFDKARSDHVVMLGDDGGMFHAVAAKDGTKVWTFETTSVIHSSANMADGGRVVFGNDAAEIYCLAAADGKEIWKATAGDRINATPAIANGVALISGCDAKLRGLSLVDGKEQFAFDMGAISGASPAVIGDRIYLGADQGRVMCLSADGKTQHWLRELPDAPMVFASAAVSEGVMVVGARDRTVYGLSTTDGKDLWTFKTKGDVDSSPVISGGRVYIGSKDKRLYVLDLKSGEKLFDFQAGRAIVAPVAAGQGVIVVGDTAGSVFCLEPK
jgi:outer membrane protein assembly factor BamB